MRVQYVPEMDFISGNVDPPRAPEPFEGDPVCNPDEGIYLRAKDVFEALDCSIGQLSRDRVEDAIGAHRDGDKDWYLDGSFTKTVQILSEGWPEGLERARKNLDKIPEVTVPKRSGDRLRVDGDEVHIERFVTGERDHMLTRTKVPSPLVRITVSITTVWRHTPENMFWRGAAALKLIEGLETAGYRCEVTAICGVRQMGYFSGAGRSIRHGYGILEVPLKNFYEPVRPTLLAACLASPGLMRVGMFRMMGHVGEIETKYGNSQWEVYSGFGRCGYEPMEPFRGDIHIPQCIVTEESANRFLRDIARTGMKGVKVEV